MFEAFKVKKIPRLFWSSEKTFTLIPQPLPLFMLLFGLFLFGFGEALLVVSGIGMSPWTVLADGVASVTGWTIGGATFVISSCVLLLWLPLRQVPGIGTILNVLVVAAVIEFFHLRLPTFDYFPLKILGSLRWRIDCGVRWWNISYCKFGARTERWIDDWSAKTLQFNISGSSKWNRSLCRKRWMDSWRWSRDWHVTFCFWNWPVNFCHNVFSPTRLFFSRLSVAK